MSRTFAFYRLHPGFFRKADPEPTASEPVTLTDPLAAWLFGAQPTYSNISVTPQTAMRVPAVASAVTLISDAVGTLPVKLYVRNGKGKEADTAHPAFTFAHDEANDWTSAAELRTQLTRDALLHDNGGFALAVRGGSGNVVEFHRLDPKLSRHLETSVVDRAANLEVGTRSHASLLLPPAYSDPSFGLLPLRQKVQGSGPQKWAS